MPPPEPDDVPWELYHVDEDYSQARNVADEHPELLRSLQQRFLTEAAVNKVLPLLAGTARREGPPLPSTARGRSTFTFHDGTTRIPPASAPDVANRDWEVVADVEVPEGGANGFVFGQGGHNGGHALYLLDGRLVYHYNLLGLQRWSVASEQPVAPGPRRLGVEYQRAGQGFGDAAVVRLTVDGAQVGELKMERSTPWRMSYIEGTNVGSDTGTPVSPDYRCPFPFEGTLRTVTVDLK